MGKAFLIIAVVFSSCSFVPAVGGEGKERSAGAIVQFRNDINVITEQTPEVLSVSVELKEDPIITNNVGKSIRVKNENGRIVLPPLPCGFYRIYAGGKQIGQFAVVIAREKYPSDNNTAIAVDYAMNTARLPSGVSRQKFFRRNAKMAAMAGVKLVRERFRIRNKNIVPGPSGLKVKDNDPTTVALKALDEEGILVGGMLMSFDKKFARDGRDRASPENVLLSYELYSACARKWGKYLSYIEIGNEIDLRTFYAGSASEYAAAFKAARKAFTQYSPETLVLPSSYARPALFLKKGLWENGVDKQARIYNFHTYASIELLHEYSLSVLKDFPGKAWCTECGLTVGAVDFSGGKDLPDKAVQKASRQMGGIYAEILAAGTEKVFFFLWRHHPGVTAYILDRKFMATETYAALATLNRVLGNAVYEGTLVNDKFRAHKFGDGRGSSALLLWTPQEQTTAKVKAEGNYQIISHSGEILAVGNASGLLEIPLQKETTVYLKAEKYADNFKDLSVKKKAGVISVEGKDVIPELRVTKEASNDYDVAKATYRFKPDSTNKVILELSNLSQSPYKGKIRLSAENGWKISRSEFLAEIEPMKNQSCELTLEAPACTDKGPVPGFVKAVTEQGNVSALPVGLKYRYLKPAKIKKAFTDLSTGRWVFEAFNANTVKVAMSSGEKKVKFTSDFIGEGARMGWPVCEGLPDAKKLCDWSGYDAVKVTLNLTKVKPGTWFMLTAREKNRARYASARIVADTPGKHELLFVFSHFSYLWEDSGPDGPEFSFDTDKIAEFGIGFSTRPVPGFKNFKKVMYPVEYELVDMELLKF